MLSTMNPRSGNAPGIAGWTLGLGSLALALLATGCGGPAGGDDGPNGGKADVWGDDSSAWVAKRGWTAEDGETFSTWIAGLGEARANGTCLSLAECLASPQANSLYEDEDQGRRVFADCADLPYVLRAYFAYKLRLPFSFVSEINGAHYTTGNTVAGHNDFRDYDTLKGLLVGIANQVHSGFFRLGPDVEDGDHFPITISRESVRPGTMYYDPNGHVLLVYAIEPNGTVRLMDGHPDNSLTVQRFGEAFARGSAAQGGGFRNWREQWVEAGGRMVRARNQDSTFFSASEQYPKSFDADGEAVGYHDWVRFRLSESGSRRQPVKDMAEMVTSLCTSLQDRLGAVQKSVDGGISEKSHPASLPSNIYGTTGEWESFSTPSRDARLKAAFRELHRVIGETVATVKAGGSSKLDYTGTAAELVAAYQRTWDEGNARCALSYTNSARQTVTLDLNAIMDRLYDLSFDPYHCAELRWGASPDVPARAGELSSCKNNKNKIDWYRNEYRLRNNIDRDYDSVTDLNFGPETPADVHVPRLLKALAK